MKNIITKTLLISLIFMLMSCSGMRQTENTFYTHAESFRILGFPIPEDDQAAARALVPAGAKITTVNSTPADWKSFWGFIGNLFSFHITEVSGTK